VLFGDLDQWTSGVVLFGDLDQWTSGVVLFCLDWTSRAVVSFCLGNWVRRVLFSADVLCGADVLSDAFLFNGGVVLVLPMLVVGGVVTCDVLTGGGDSGAHQRGTDSWLR
jgi:hypothetical protein